MIDKSIRAIAKLIKKVQWVKLWINWHADSHNENYDEMLQLGGMEKFPLLNRSAMHDLVFHVNYDNNKREQYFITGF
jgi:hypothetical protein